MNSFEVKPKDFDTSFVGEEGDFFFLSFPFLR